MSDSISFRFNLITSLVVIILLGGFGAYNHKVTEAALDQQLERQLDAATQRLQQSLPVTLWNYESAQTQSLVDAEVSASSIAAIYVFDDKGKLNLGRQSTGGVAPAAALLEQIPTTGLREATLHYKDNTELKSVGKLQLVPDRSAIESLQRDSLIRTLAQSAVLVAILLGAVSWLLRQLVTRPIDRVNAALKDIAEGDGDLTRRLAVLRQDEIGELATAFNRFVDKIQHLVTQVIGSVSAISTATGGMKAIAERTAEGVGQQRHETDQVATAMNEMTTAAQEVSQSAQQAANAAQQADREGQQARQVVSGAIDAIRQLATDIESGAQVINSLEQDVGQITGVVDVIRGIAEQTNLLALNAAIEAARAGEQGRGFAVVADEVRTLASRTQSSTSEINNMIERLTNGAHRAVEVMQSSKQKGERTVEQANQAEANLSAVSEAITRINDMNNQIASAAEQQTAVTDDINRSLARIVEIAEATASDTRENQSESERLQNRSRELHQLVSHFKV